MKNSLKKESKISEELQRLKNEVFALKAENVALTNLNECLMTTAEKIAANIIRVYSQLEPKSPMRAKAFRALMKWEQLRRLTLTSELRREVDALNFSFKQKSEKIWFQKQFMNSAKQRFLESMSALPCDNCGKSRKECVEFWGLQDQTSTDYKVFCTGACMLKYLKKRESK